MDYLKIAKDVLTTEINGLTILKEALGENFNRAISLILSSKGRVVITGMGKSGLVGKKISATLASTGTPSFFIHPGEAYHGDLGMVRKEDIIIAISYSGETDEVIKLLSFFKDNDNKIISITGKKGSTLERHSDVHLELGEAKEACPYELAPTTSTTSTLALGDALAIALIEANKFKPENFARFHPGGSLGRKLLVKVKDLMKKENLPVVRENSTFEEIVSSVSSGRLGMVVVLDSSNQVIGVITDGDIRRGIEKYKEKVLEIKSKDMMSTNPLMISSDEKIIEAEKIMQDRKITTLLVVKDKKLEGILHRYDL